MARAASTFRLLTLTWLWLVTGALPACANFTSAEGVTYGYNFENRLISRNGSQVEWVYDGDGNRVQRKASGTITHYYLVDDRNPTGFAQVLEETSWPGTTPLGLYTYGANLIRLQANGVVRYFGYDGLGSTRLLVEGAPGSTSGDITDTYTYDAFGVLIRHTDGAGNSPGPTTNPYRFAGERWDADLGFYYLWERYYNPSLGRFWTMDTFKGNLSDPLSLHKYLYAHNNPVNMTDPSGHWSIGATVATVGIISAVTAITLPSITHVQKPGFGQSLIPIVGSTWNATYNFQEGNYGWTAFNVAMAATDVFLARSVAKAGVNVVSKLGQVGAESLAPLLNSSGQWVSRPGGLKLLDAGGYFVKAGDPAARGFTKWFAVFSIAGSTIKTTGPSGAKYRSTLAVVCRWIAVIGIIVICGYELATSRSR